MKNVSQNPQRRWSAWWYKMHVKNLVTHSEFWRRRFFWNIGPITDPLQKPRVGTVKTITSQVEDSRRENLEKKKLFKFSRRSSTRNWFFVGLGNRGLSSKAMRPLRQPGLWRSHFTSNGVWRWSFDFFWLGYRPLLSHSYLGAMLVRGWGEGVNAVMSTFRFFFFP